MTELNLINLTVLPFIAALCCMIARGESTRSVLVVVTGFVLAASSLSLIGSGTVQMVPELMAGAKFSTFIQFADFSLLGLILYFGIKSKSRTITGLFLIQILLLAVFDFYILKGSHAAPAGIFCDNLSLIMVLIVSIAGSLIILYAIPYMKSHEHHLGLKITRQPCFFSFLFVFIGAMNALVLVNDLMLFYFFFEVTTLCSFLLIGHDQTRQSKENSITALWINSLGGLALLVGIILIFLKMHTLDIQVIINQGKFINGMMLPFGLLCIAGFTKAAQMPFQKWLLGAMVAPTPTSALLHSSTMVKAGVYLVIRFAPAFANTYLSAGVALCGAFTFLSAAALAIGQSNGKKVLAYSTISNLGLILACAGINTPSAITAAIFLVIFHAVSKALLFLCVGTIEQHIGSRDIEDMRGLFGEMPKTALIITLGILTMILPPFGMLLGKWMAIQSATGNLLTVIMLALGSALSVVYWARWAGILMGENYQGKSTPENLPLFSKIPLYSLLGSAMGLSILAPLIYSEIIAADFFGSSLAPFTVNFGTFTGPNGSFAVLLLFLVALPVFLYGLKRSFDNKSIPFSQPYMSGIQGKEKGTYIGPMNRVMKTVQSNYYLSAFFSEEKLSRNINLTAFILLIIMIGVSI